MTVSNDSDLVIRPKKYLFKVTSVAIANDENKRGSKTLCPLPHAPKPKASSIGLL